jgi:hypothetical protein
MQAGQALAYQRSCSGVQIDVLVQPPACQAVGVAVAEADGAARLQQENAIEDSSSDKQADARICLQGRIGDGQVWRAVPWRQSTA